MSRLRGSQIDTVPKKPGYLELEYRAALCLHSFAKATGSESTSRAIGLIFEKAGHNLGQLLATKKLMELKTNRNSIFFERVQNPCRVPFPFPPSAPPIDPKKRRPLNHPCSLRN